MDYLLDTHTFLWADADPERLSDRARDIVNDPTNRLFLSVASLWEMQIKTQLGKLILRMPLMAIVQEHTSSGGLTVWSVEPGHVYALSALPTHHKDPFDRLIVATAKAQDITIISNDPVVGQYPVRVVW